MEKIKRESDEEIWVHDSSVDYKGNVPLRASTGVWKASLFIISKINLIFHILIILFPASLACLDGEVYVTFYLNLNIIM